MLSSSPYSLRRLAMSPSVAPGPISMAIGIARHHPQQDEHDHRYPEQGRNRQEQPAGAGRTRTWGFAVRARSLRPKPLRGVLPGQNPHCLSFSDRPGP